MERKTKSRHVIHTFDIDTYINPIVPRPRFDILPPFISRWFGYRPPRKESESASPQTSVLLVWLFSFLGAFIGIAIIENVFLRLPRLEGKPVPIVVASFGAAAILEYNAIESPLSQPRNLILGHSLAAVVGVGVTKLFHLLPEARFQDLRWLAGALSVASASLVMSVTKTVHPPAGATALLAATTQDFIDLGWWLVILVLLGGALMLASAMLVNNLYKKFPVYWWTPVDLKKQRESDKATIDDEERAESKSEGSTLGSGSEAGAKDQWEVNGQRKASDIPDTDHKEDLSMKDGKCQHLRHVHSEMRIDKEAIIVPEWMQLSDFEISVLEMLQKKLVESSSE